MNAISIVPADMPGHLATVRELFREYADGIGVDLCFQGFEAELAELPGKYAAPNGRLLLCWQGERAVGCVAMRPLDNGDCEMKRLYVRPEMRGARLGQQLVERVCAEAREAGYRRIFLDTLPTMTAAIGLYVTLGFTETEPYVFNPVSGVRYLVRTL
jgi:ribosomal protein S18 acetylase RimI-like enzyme